MASSSNLVVVTGFGPFLNYPVNSSWEAVKELSKLGLGNEVHLKILELPVIYAEVEKIIKNIWTELQPKLCVHVGMLDQSPAILLEQCARNKGYTDEDFSGALPQEGCCFPEGPELSESSINMKSVCKNISLPEIDAIWSNDAGRYLCEYTYYMSLYRGKGRALFIHVPQLSDTLTAEKLGQALLKIIQEVLRQLEHGSDLLQ